MIVCHSFSAGLFSEKGKGEHHLLARGEGLFILDLICVHGGGWYSIIFVIA